MEYSDGFIPIAAVFYAVFHPTEGTKIVHQVPQGCISSSSVQSENDEEVLFHFDTVKNYIIPKPQLCNKLISFKINKFRVIGYPVNIENSHYARNSFNFNFCFVFPYDIGDLTPYESAVRRIGTMFKVLEEQSYILSKLDKNNSFYKASENSDHPVSRRNFLTNTPGHSRTKNINLLSIESLICQIYLDLNYYSECCIPLDSANSVDIKLFPILPPPINIKAYQVPIATVKLDNLIDINSDPTMVKILPYINGLNSIKKISELANANYILTMQCIQHLMHYKCIKMIDIFQFSNIYAPTNHIGNFLKFDGRMAEECQAYVISNSGYHITQTPMSSNSASLGLMNSVSPGTKGSYFSKSLKTSSNSNQNMNIKIPSQSTLFYLYRSFNQGQTVKEWYVQNHKLLENVDIRRFINFGVLRNLIYRVHSYPILNSITRSIEGDEYFTTDFTGKKKKAKEHEPTTLNVSFSKDTANDDYESQTDDSRSTYSTESEELDKADDMQLVRKLSTKSSTSSSHEEEDEDMKNLVKLLKGFQHFDSLCTELKKSRKEVEAMIAKLGNYNLANS